MLPVVTRALIFIIAGHCVAVWVVVYVCGLGGVGVFTTGYTLNTD